MCGLLGDDVIDVPWRGKSQTGQEPHALSATLGAEAPAGETAVCVAAGSVWRGLI